jgi:hypothetical protein
MEAAGLQPGSELLERIVGADSALVVVKTGQPEVMIEQFKQAARRSGQAVYAWHEEVGLYSLREGDVRVPGCRRVGDTLRYVVQSMHFGIYLMTGIQGVLGRAEQTLLRKLARDKANYVRRVVLLTNDEALIASVEDLAEVFGSSVRDTQPRLRDGRWVV